ncbi:MAG: phage tail protein [Phycisphaerales bacterium]
MTPYTEKLYQLLPAIYRIRDEGQDWPLRALLEILGEQADTMDENIAQLYENWFIETCEPWVVPYIGELLGVRGLHEVTDAAFSQRAQVANALRYRRRKGTAAMLEQLAHDTTGWSTRVVEFFQRLETTQHLNHLRPENLRTPDLRDGAALERADTPFDSTSRTVEVRSIATGRGRYNLPNVGFFLWRLRAYPVRRAPAFDHGNGRFSFSQLGNDIPLFRLPVAEEDITHLAEECNVPEPIRRRGFLARKDDHYGEDRSLLIWLNGVTQDATKIVPCNLENWIRRPGAGQIAVDPELGRLAFPPGEAPEKVEVRYAYGFGADLGGGFYDREQVEVPGAVQCYRIGQTQGYKTLQDAVTQWINDDKPSAAFLIQDSEFYDVDLDISVPAGRTLEIRADRNDASEQQRPVLRLKSALKLAGAPPDDDKTAPAAVVLDGLWLAGNQVQAQAGSLGELTVRHCTLVPGWTVNPDDPAAPAGSASLIADVANAHLVVTLDRCITGPVLLAGGEKLAVRDSIIAANGGLAIEAQMLAVERSTILGCVNAREVELASNSIFTGLVVATRRQAGCVRFCSLPRDSRVPRRYRCQPNLAIQQAHEKAKAQDKPVPTTERENGIAVSLKPAFGSEHYGQPEFAQLLSAGPREILTGADDESEMGAFHHVRAPQREGNLRASLDEYLRAGLEAGLFYVDLIDPNRGRTYESRFDAKHVQPREALQQRADAARPRAARRGVERAAGYSRASRGGRNR